VEKTSVRLTLQLGVTQTIGYASSYYLPAILAVPISNSIGISFERFFVFLAAASLISAFLGPRLGRLIDSFGGRLMLPISSLLFAAGLLLMSVATTQFVLLMAWLVVGIAMAGGLYDAAFASVVEIQGDDSRRTIAGITLIAGFASTIGWPITSAIASAVDWQTATLFWAGAHVLIGLPLHLTLPGYKQNARRERRLQREVAETSTSPVMLVILMGALFALGGFTQVAVGIHLPGLLGAGGVTPELALAVATLLGPGQVLARILQVGLPQTFTPVRVAGLALILHPVGALAWLAFGDIGMVLFVVLHGMGSGFLTVAGGVLPLYVFGSKNYGQRQGYIMAASKILLAFAPLIFGAALVSVGVFALAFTVASALLSVGILGWLLTHRRSTNSPAE
jgi:predicted MFS family arabinose efflux permease